jgi:hypothetical protein
MNLDEKTLADAFAAIKAVRTHFILREDEVDYEIEMWENGRMNLMIIVPSRISHKVCKPCASVHFSEWFRTRYPDSIISHISFTDRATLGQQEVI